MPLFAALTLMILLSSCSLGLEKSNQDFIKKYQEEISQINQQRTPDKETKNETLFSAPPTREEVVKELANKAEYYPYSDISLIGDSPREEALPNRETYELSKAKNPNNSLPTNIFEISYNLNLYPPFRRIGAEFDGIEIPQKDAFGVATNLSEKNYLLIGNNSLQRNIDKINSEKSDGDIEVTKMLVAEKKKILKQQKSNQLSSNEIKAEEPLPEVKKAKEETAKETISTKTKTAVENVSGFVRSVITNAKTPQQK
jgi:hypothetical protein